MNIVEGGYCGTVEGLKLHRLKVTALFSPSFTFAIALGKAADIAVVGTIAIAEVDIHDYEGGYDRDDHDFHQ